jgi:hypothetical protein
MKYKHVCKKWRVKLGLLHFLNEIRKFPLGRRRDCCCREHKVWTKKRFTIF